MRAFQGGAVTHEVEAEAGPLACLAHPGAGQPDRRHQVAARELGEHVGVDAVGLGGQRGQTLDLLRIGEVDAPAAAFQFVVDEARPVHRLEGGVDRLAAAGEPIGETAEPVAVRRGGRDGDPLPALIEKTDVHTLP